MLPGVNRLLVCFFVGLAVIPVSSACRSRSARVAASGTTAPTELPPAGTAAPLTLTPTDEPTDPPPTRFPTNTPFVIATPAPPDSGTLAAISTPLAGVTPQTPGVIPTITPFTPAAGQTFAPTRAAANTRVPASVGDGRAVYVTRVRIEPGVPRNKEDVTFIATMSNGTGRAQVFNLCAELFRPGEGRSFGITRCDGTSIPPGVSEQRSSGWQISGVRECIPVRARIVALGGAGERTAFKQPNGRDLWFDFQACP
jgi:hypothetical protein